MNLDQLDCLQGNTHAIVSRAGEKLEIPEMVGSFTVRIIYYVGHLVMLWITVVISRATWLCTVRPLIDNPRVGVGLPDNTRRDTCYMLVRRLTCGETQHGHVAALQHHPASQPPPLRWQPRLPSHHDVLPSQG